MPILLIFVVIALVIACCIALIYSGLFLSTTMISEHRVSIMETLRETSYLQAWLALFGFSSCVALIGALGVFYEPAAAGSGMPEVIAYLNGAKLHRFITWRILVGS